MYVENELLHTCLDYRKLSLLLRWAFSPLLPEYLTPVQADEETGGPSEKDDKAPEQWALLPIQTFPHPAELTPRS